MQIGKESLSQIFSSSIDNKGEFPFTILTKELCKLILINDVANLIPMQMFCYLGEAKTRYANGCTLYDDLISYSLLL